VLERNELYGYGVEHETATPARVTVTTRVKAVSAIQVQSPSDDQFAPYRKLIEELRELAAADGTQAPAGHGKAMIKTPSCVPPYEGDSPDREVSTAN
jgi:hypothetical protein